MPSVQISLGRFQGREGVDRGSIWWGTLRNQGDQCWEVADGQDLEDWVPFDKDRQGGMWEVIFDSCLNQQDQGFFGNQGWCPQDCHQCEDSFHFGVQMDWEGPDRELCWTPGWAPSDRGLVFDSTQSREVYDTVQDFVLFDIDREYRGLSDKDLEKKGWTSGY